MKNIPEAPVPIAQRSSPRSICPSCFLMHRYGCRGRLVFQASTEEPPWREYVCAGQRHGTEGSGLVPALTYQNHRHGMWQEQVLQSPETGEVKRNGSSA